MSQTPTQAEANAAALAAQTALTTEANALFIQNANSVIADLTSQGKYQVFLTHSKNVSFKDIAEYFRGLGYTVGFPICPAWQNGFYGYPYYFTLAGYYANCQICCCAQPCRIFISWATPGQPWPWPWGWGL